MDVLTTIEDCEISIEDIACKYPCVAEFAGSTLRAARLSCNNIKVIAFEMISRSHFATPKYVLSDSEGIGWINADGAINPNTFAKTALNLRDRPSLREKILQLVENT